MKFTLLPIFATSLPMLLVQHATLANAAALCIPGIYCPENSSTTAAVPDCSSPADGNTPASSSPAADTDSLSATEISSPTLTVLPYTSSPAVPIVDTTTSTEASEPTYLPGESSSSEYAGSSSASGETVATTTVTITSLPTASGSSCSTGPVQCCNSVQPSSSEGASQMLGLLGIVLQGADVPVGLNCIPLSVIGIGSAGNCNAQTVCCENNSFNGLVNIGCTPINLGL